MRSSVALMLLAMMSLQGCATSGRVSEFCVLSKPIYFDPADRMTQATEKAIITHNETWEMACKL